MKEPPPAAPAPRAPGCAPPGRKPPRPPKAPSLRIWSYCLRFSSSESTAYASEISLNRSAAAGSLALASGWCCFASFRYAFLISSAGAFSGTPRIR